MGEIEAERRFFEPSNLKGESGRWKRNMSRAALSAYKDHIASLRPGIPTFVDPLDFVLFCQIIDPRFQIVLQ